MKPETVQTTDESVDAEFSARGSFERYIGHVPAAFAVTRGPLHALVYANAAFRDLFTPDAEPLLGSPIADAFAIRDTIGLTPLLDRAFRTGVVSRNSRMGSVGASELPLSCTVWPDVSKSGECEHLVIELRPATQGELTLGLQREMAERLLLSALREQEAADVAEASRRGAAFLAAESRRLAESLDEGATLAAMERMSLPHVGAWCIVDTLDVDGTMSRLAIIHPDPGKQALLQRLEGRWVPELGDGFGLPATLRSAGRTVVAGDVDAALASAHDPEISRALSELGVGPMLTVPLIIGERLVGAVTFVGGPHAQPFTPQDMELAEDLASRSAMALDRARLYGEAVALKIRAEFASQAKSTFLGMMSHELRTPLNAIGGYVDLMDLEIHGPITEAQRVDLARIRSNQRYLMGLISDLLNLTRVDSGLLTYKLGDVVVRDIVDSSVALVEPLITQRRLVYEGVVCEPGITARGDPERVSQILVNLLSNAIKFTLPGGRLVIHAVADGDRVMLRIADTGIGIPPDKLDDIFEPFVQVKGASTGPEAGIGLGLAISRSLARAMHGDLTVESALDQGSCFTLTLPRSSTDHQSADRAT